MVVKVHKVILGLVFIFYIFSASCDFKKLTFFSVNNNPIDQKTFVSRVNTIVDSAKVAGIAMVIIQDSKISFEHYYGFENVETKDPITENTVFEVASLSKPVFSYFVMKQREKGIIELDTPLYKILPLKELAHDKRHELLTARMLLNHTSGLPNWRRETNDSLQLFFNPGEKYNYSGEGYQYLKDVLAHQLHVNDAQLDGIFREEICEPFHIKNMSFVWNRGIKLNKAYGHRNNIPTDNMHQRDPNLFGAAFSLHCNTKDYAKFIIGVMNKKGLNTTSWNEFMRVSNHKITSKTEEIRSLGFNVQKSKDGYDIHQHKGSNGDFKSLVRFYPHNNYGIVLLSNSDNLYSSGLVRYILSVIKS
ncbi:serine hydrolase domain-containing protein [Aquimarina litoralis]|uniref:serine hydrolase domain-containing protein n=1 Tax=Aquimarina litoralis TaxID=584605 RepID=UPI001C59E110|nr:serine hydrolase domain-containing protein [Aquimarina litoralis]MBW1298192.1 serine hydrolase [Aquimarina litoralis]